MAKVAKQICNLEQDFGLVWKEMQPSLPTKTDAHRNHDLACSKGKRYVDLYSTLDDHDK